MEKREDSVFVILGYVFIFLTLNYFAFSYGRMIAKVNFLEEQYFKNREELRDIKSDIENNKIDIMVLQRNIERHKENIDDIKSDVKEIKKTIH